MHRIERSSKHIDTIKSLFKASLLAAVSSIILQGNGVVAEAQTSTSGNSAPQKSAPEKSSRDHFFNMSEITVTARKRSETLQDVPISITAVSGQRIERERIKGLADISYIAPSLNFLDLGSGRGQISIRGLASGVVATDQPTVRERVGIYLDEVPIAMARRNPDIRLVDMARVEVLRGPQGTLYGAGSLGGAVKFVTNAPNLQDIEYGAKLDISKVRYGGWGRGANGYINVPLVEDKLAIRLAGYYDHDAGYIDNIKTGRDNVNSTNFLGGRIEMTWKPTDKLTLTGKIFAQDMRLNGNTAVDRNVNGLPPGEAQPTGLQQRRVIDEHHRDKFVIYNLDINYDLGWANLFSSTSFNDRTTSTVSDFTGFSEVYYGSSVPAYFNEDVPVKDFVQEVRLVTNGDGPFKGVFGVFYNHHKHGYDAVVPSYGFTEDTGVPTAPYGTNDILYEGHNTIKESQIAFFTELSYDITQDFTATAGVRWFRQKQDFSIYADGLYNGDVKTGLNKLTEKGFNPKFQITYKPDENTLISAQAVKGFRLGGGNDKIPLNLCAADLSALGITDPPNSFNSETAWNYELLGKFQLFNKKLTLNPSLFYIEYSNMQVSQALPSCLFNFISNAGKAHSKGLELEAVASVTENLTLIFGGSYIDAKLAADMPPGVVGQKGDRLPLTPKYSFNASARYEFGLRDDLRGFGQFDYHYMGKVIMTLGYDRSPISTAPPLGSWSTGNIRIGVNNPKWEAALFVKNVWDQKAKLYWYKNAVADQITPLQPRTIGMEVSFHY